MARLVEEAIIEFGDAVKYTKVITKNQEGAKRYKEIIKQQKNLVPIPSIFINGQLTFKTIPGKEELVGVLNHIIHKQV